MKIVVTTLDYFSSCHFARYAYRACQIYPPIDQARFGQRDTGNLRQKLGIEGDPYLIGFVGRIVAEKGLGYLIESIPFLEDRYEDFMVLVAGDYENIAGGSVKSELDRLISRYPERVLFTGFLKFDELLAFYNLIDVLVLPSVDPLEAFGMVQIEAMLCGTPVIASDMPGVREVVGVTGFGKLVKRKDPQDIADKVDELMKHPVALSGGGLKIFSYERSIDEYENVFMRIVG